MAMSQLKVTPSKLKSEASDIKKNANQVKSTTGDMMSTINSISDSVWSGDAASEFTGRFKKLQDDMDKIYAMIIEYSDDLETIAKMYEQTEKANDSLAGSLSVDI